MARKDVDLVIRAKDEAGKVVDSISASIMDFVKAVGGLEKSGGTTNTVLKQLGVSLGNLEKNLKGASVGDKLAEQMDKASAASARLSADLEKTQKTAADLERDLKKAGQGFDFYEKKAKGAAEAQVRQTAAVERAKAAQAGLIKGLADTNAARDKGEKKLVSLSAEIERNNELLAKSVERYQRLKGQIAATDAPTATLQARFESVSNSVAKYETKLDGLHLAAQNTAQSIAKAGNDIAGFGAKIEASNADVSRTERILKEIGANYEAAAAKAKSFERSQRDLQGQAVNTAAALAKIKTSVDAAEAEMISLGIASGKAEAALGELASKTGGALTASFTAQRRAMLETKREWVEQTASVKAYSAEISAAGVPTAKMAASLKEAKIAAAGAKQAYDLQKAGLAELAAINRQEAQTVDQLRAKTAAYTAASLALATALEKVQRETAQSTAENRKYFESLERVANASRTTQAPKPPTPPDPSLVDKLSAAYRGLYGETRQSLSYTQRLRGEVLALISAYGGIYGVIEGLRGVVEATQKIEAVQARLRVVTRGDNDAAGKEYDFIRRQADRLGISLGDLADEYSKFAIAAQGTVLEGENTRKIFISVAQAAKVQKLSFADLQGVFKALTQIVSKGKVNLEELGQQLGDRLPGAIGIMADALGVGQAELLKMITAGEVMSDSLIKFAAELDKRFGGQLEESLKGLSTALGQLQNAAFQALAAFGEGGFIEGFTGLVKQLTETLKSAQFESFAAKVSAAFGVLASILATAAKYFDVLVIAASAFIGVKLAPVIAALVTSFGGLFKTTTSVAAGMSAAGAAAGTAATGAGLAATAFGALRVAMLALLSSTGIGLLVTGISIAIGAWATRTEEATDALNTHRTLLDQVKNAYDATGGSIEKMRASLAGATVTQLQVNAEKLKEQITEARKESDTFIDRKRGAARSASYTPEAQAQFDQIEKLRLAFARGEGDVKSYVKALDEVGKVAQNSKLKEYTADLIDRTTEVSKLTTALDENGKAQTVLTGTMEDAKAKADELAGVTKNAAGEQEKAAKATSAFNAALDELKALVPDVDDKFKNLKAEEKLTEAYNAAKKLAEAITDVTEKQKALNSAADAYKSGLDSLDAGAADKAFNALDLKNAANGIEAAAKLLRSTSFEGFAPRAKYDVNAPRNGFGSDTMTAPDGSFRKVTMGEATTREDANRDLYRRLSTEFIPGVVKAVGKEAFEKLSAVQQGVLATITYNYGANGLPKAVANAIKEGKSDEEVAQAIKGLAADNGGIRRERYQLAGSIYAGGAGAQGADADKDFDKKRAEEAKAVEKKATDQATFNRELDQTNAKAQVEADTLKGTLLDREIAKALEEARAKAADKNLTLTKEQEAAIRKSVTARYSEASVTAEQKKLVDAAKKAEEEVNNILSTRKSIEEQIKVAQGAGQTDKVKELQAKLLELNTQLTAAATNATTMWNKVGGTEASAGIEKINAGVAAAQNIKSKAQEVYFSWSKVSVLFADGLTNAFDSFASQIAAGVKPLTALKNAFLQFAGDFLKQIAQMIIKAAILNALGVNSSGATTGGGLFGSLGMVFGAGHTGGLIGQGGRVGSGNQTRRVSPAVFAQAQRFHTGGMPGLRPSEVPIIAKAGEEILSETDPRNMLNGGGLGGGPGGGGRGETKIVNALDGSSFLSEALSSKQGERIILNYIKANSGAVKQALGS